MFPDRFEDLIGHRLGRLLLRRICRESGADRNILRHFIPLQIAFELTPSIPALIGRLDVGSCAVKRRELSIYIFFIGLAESASRAVIIYPDQHLTRLWHGGTCLGTA